MKKIIKPVAFFAALGSLFLSCSKDSVKTSIASVATSNVTVVDEVSATVGGNVTSDGGAAITKRGVCYATSHNPTISNDTTLIGSGKGEFSKTIGPLLPNTTYFARAYAINANGTSYGSEVTVTTKNVTSVVSSGLMAYYKFDGNIFDYSGNANEIKIDPLTPWTPTYVSDKANNVNSALTTNGALLSKSTINNLNTSVSISCWIYPTDNGGIDTQVICFVVGDATANSSGGFLEVNGNDKFGVGNASTAAFCQTPSLLSRSAWHHLVGTYDQNGNSTLYVDNNLVTTNFISGLSFQNGTLLIGGGGNNSGDNFNGRLDNIRVYNRALTASEVTQLYNE